MKKNLLYLNFLAALVLALFIAACEDNPAWLDAESLSFEQIRTNSRMTWFMPIYDTYTPDSLTVSKIKSLYESNPSYIVIFGIQSYCSCTPEMKYFPKIIKTFHTAGISDTSMNFLVMNSVEEGHPYKSIYSLKSLPDCMWMQNGKVIYGHLADTITAIEKNYPDSAFNVEQLILGIMTKDVK